MNADRKWLLGLAALSIVVLAGIAGAASLARIPNDSQTLLGAISAGLLLFARDVVTTIRAAWTDERTEALTDQLASSTPSDNIKPDGTRKDPISVKEVGNDMAPL